MARWQHAASTRSTSRIQGVTAIETGQLIDGHYRVLEHIGSGGMGVVWRARDERLHRMVAVKQLVLPPGLSPSEASVARVRALREARIAAKLQHPNAIVVYDVAEHEGAPCLVMEYLESRSLAAVLAEQGALTPEEAAAIGRQIAAALAAAHRAGIVHRDVKPGNVLIDETGTAKITDFGVSRATGDMTVTQTGIVAGTPAYLSPEVARGQDPTPASDVFSLGATLYTAVEGQPPFGTNQNALALLHVVASGKVRPPSQAGILTAPLMRLLRPEGDERPSMDEAARELTRAAGGRATAGRGAAPSVSNGTKVLVPSRQARNADPAHTAELPAERSAARTAAPAAPARPSHPKPPPPPDRERSPQRGRYGRIAALVAAVLLLGVAAVYGVWSLTGDETERPAGGGTQAAGPPSQERTSAPPPQPAPVDTSSGSIDWSEAGQLVIDYYNGLDDPDSAWQLLSPRGQAFFGTEEGFDTYWDQFDEVSAQNANGVTDNPDGSVNVPVDVFYDGQQQQRELRVTRLDGELLIDSDAR